MKKTASVFCILAIAITITVVTVLHSSQADTATTVFSALIPCEDVKKVQITNRQEDTHLITLHKNKILLESTYKNGSKRIVQTDGEIAIITQYDPENRKTETTKNLPTDVLALRDIFISVSKKGKIEDILPSVKKCIRQLYAASIIPKESIDLQKLDGVLNELITYLNNGEQLIVTEQNKYGTTFVISEWNQFLTSVLNILSQALTKDYAQAIENALHKYREDAEVRINIRQDKKGRTEQITFSQNNETVYTVYLSYAFG